MSLPYTTSANLPYGSFVLTMSSGNANGVAFIAEDFEVTEGASLLERPTELGAPNGAVLIDQAATGRATLQLAASTTLAPEVGDEFPKALRSNASNVTFFLTEVSLPRRARDFHVVNVSFREKV